MNGPRRQSRIILWDGLGLPVAALGTFGARKSQVPKDFSDTSHLLIAPRCYQQDPPVVPTQAMWTVVSFLTVL